MVPNRPSMLRSCEWDSPLHLASPKSEIWKRVAREGSASFLALCRARWAAISRLGQHLSLQGPTCGPLTRLWGHSRPQGHDLCSLGLGGEHSSLERTRSAAIKSLMDGERLGIKEGIHRRERTAEESPPAYARQRVRHCGRQRTSAQGEEAMLSFRVFRRPVKAWLARPSAKAIQSCNCASWADGQVAASSLKGTAPSEAL